MSKGSNRRPQKISDKQMTDNWNSIFGKKNYKEVQQDITELNSDGNRDRGRYGEDKINERTTS